MRLGARAGARIIERARRGFRARNQIGDRLDVGLRAHEQHVGRVDELADRHEILQRVVGQIVVERLVDGDGGRGEQQRIAVGRRPRCNGHAGIAASAAAVVDDHRLAQRLLQGERDDARNDVGRPARRERHDQGDHALGIGSVRGHGDDERRGRCQYGGQRMPTADRSVVAGDAGHHVFLPRPRDAAGYRGGGPRNRGPSPF
jgi:hypothetical protein